MKLGFVDVSRAYFYAPVRKKIFVRISPEDFESGDESNVGLLNYSMHGTQDAAFNWGEFCTDTLAPIGFVQGLASSCNYHHSARDINLTVHGDGFIHVMAN